MNRGSDNPVVASVAQTDELGAFLARGLGVAACRILLPSRAEQQLVEVSSFPAVREARLCLPLDCPLVAWVRGSTGAAHLAVEGGARGATPEPLARAARQRLRELGYAHAFSMRLDPRPPGLLLAGGGTGSESLEAEVVRQVGLFVPFLNRLLAVLLAAESHELLGHLSRGLAHDLRGWLTPVMTYLQLAGGPGPDRSRAEELRPTALGNLAAIQSCLEEARHYAKHQGPRLRAIRVKPVLERSVALAEAALKSRRARVVIRAGAELEAEMDEVLVLRLLNNLLTNAIRASPPEAEIQMELDRSEAEVGRAGLRLRVTNLGSAGSLGAAEREGSVRPRSEHPGESRWGLGLQICHEIVHLHGGTMRLSSKENPPATVVEVWLPRTHSGGVES